MCLEPVKAKRDIGYLGIMGGFEVPFYFHYIGSKLTKTWLPRVFHKLSTFPLAHWWNLYTSKTSSYNMRSFRPHVLSDWTTFQIIPLNKVSLIFTSIWVALQGLGQID